MAESEDSKKAENRKLDDITNNLTKLNITTDQIGETSHSTGLNTNSYLSNIAVLANTLVNQSRSSLQSQETVAKAELEARKEAARAGKEKAVVQDVLVTNWQDEQKNEEGGGFLSGLKDILKTKMIMGGLSIGSLFGKGGIKKLLATLGTTLFTGIKTAFGAIGTKFTTLLGPSIMKFMGPAAIVAGLALALKSGFDGWVNSADWGVSKISGFLGGFLGGEADGGIKNSFKNAGKWALIGAGIGSVVPVIGTLVGGLVGAAIGGILGFFGAKKIAKAFDKIGAWFKKSWKGITKAWKGITKFVSEIWDKVVTWFKEKWEWASGGIAAGWTSVSGYISEIWDKVVTWFKEKWEWASGGIAAGWTSLSGYISEKWDKVVTWFKEKWEWASEGIAAGWTNLSGYISEKWQKVKTWFSEKLAWASGGIAAGWTTLSNYVSDIWEKVKTWFTSLFSWGKKAGGTEEGGWSLNKFIFGKEGLIEKIRGYISGLFTWGKKAGETEEGGWSLSKFIYGEPDGVLSKIRTWLNGLFSFEGKDGEKVGLGDKIVDLFKTIPDKIVQFFKDMVANVQEIFSSISMPWEDSKEEKAAEAKKVNDKLNKRIEESKKEIPKLEQAVKDNPTATGYGSPADLLKNKQNELAQLQKDLAKSNYEIALAANAKDNQKVLDDLQLKGSGQYGNIVDKTGLYMLHGSESKPEFILDNQAASVFMQAAATLADLQRQKIDLSQNGSANMAPVNVITSNQQSVTTQPVHLAVPLIRAASNNKLPG